MQFMGPKLNGARCKNIVHYISNNKMLLLQIAIFFITSHNYKSKAAVKMT